MSSYLSLKKICTSKVRITGERALENNTMIVETHHFDGESTRKNKGYNA
jgi:hypothetical protein